MTQLHSRGCCFAWVDTVMEEDMTETEEWMHIKRGALAKVWNCPERISLDHLHGCASSPMPTALPLRSFSQSPVAKV